MLLELNEDIMEGFNLKLINIDIQTIYLILKDPELHTPAYF